MSYFFADSTIPDKSDADLFALIQQWLPTANDCVDGISLVRDEHIDYAKDIIEQARDVLVSRGVSFTEEMKQKLAFLDWCTPSEKEKDRARAMADFQTKQGVMEVARAELSVVVTAFKQEASEFLNPLLRYSASRLGAKRVRLDAKQQGVQLEVSGHCTGAQFREYQRRFEKLLGKPIRTGYCCSTPGVKMEHDPNLYFCLYLPLCSDGRFYAMVRNVVCSVVSSSVVLRLEADRQQLWESVADSFMVGAPYWESLLSGLMCSSVVSEEFA